MTMPDGFVEIDGHLVAVVMDADPKVHRLLAAAPDLLAALEEIAAVLWNDHEDCRYCDSPEGGEHDPDALCGLAIAAIAKATGRGT